eukprot:356091-Chlamydomonas_euryale.AAC.4
MASGSTRPTDDDVRRRRNRAARMRHACSARGSTGQEARGREAGGAGNQFGGHSTRWRHHTHGRACAAPQHAPNAHAARRRMASAHLRAICGVRGKVEGWRNRIVRRGEKGRGGEGIWGAGRAGAAELRPRP